MKLIPTSLKGVKKWKNQTNGFFVYRLHYSADPTKDSAWANRERLSMPINDWNREYEIDFSSFCGKPVFQHDFDQSRMVAALKSDMKFPVIRAWDFGYHHPCVTWSQIIDGISHRVLLMNMGNDIDFRLFARSIVNQTMLNFPDQTIVDCCDRAGEFVKTTDDTDVRILVNEFGIIPRRKYTKVRYGLDLLRKLMNTTYRHLPCFMVNDIPENQILIDALRGGYHFREETLHHPEKEEPEKDGTYDHPIDCIRYAVVNFLLADMTYSEAMRSMATEHYQERPAL